MAKKISISFKETKRDQQLWEIINQMDDKSYELKEILRKALIKEIKEIKEIEAKEATKEATKEHEPKKAETTEPNILDF